MTLEPKPGFPWALLRWDDADKPQRDDCSLCGVAIDEDAVPLRLWDAASNGAVLCDPCAERWFGLQAMAREIDDG